MLYIFIQFNKEQTWKTKFKKIRIETKENVIVSLRYEKQFNLL